MICLDNDLLIMDDIYNLWKEFDDFGAFGNEHPLIFLFYLFYSILFLTSGPAIAVIPLIPHITSTPATAYLTTPTTHALMQHAPLPLASEHDNLISMTVDQSKGWYYRFQDPTDEFYSSGWAGTTNRCGVNGGVQLHHLANVRNQTFHWTNLLIGLTHSGAQRSLTDLQAFGILQVRCRNTKRQLWNVRRKYNLTKQNLVRLPVYHRSVKFR